MTNKITSFIPSPLRGAFAKQIEDLFALEGDANPSPEVCHQEMDCFAGARNDVLAVP